jgi:hypothetical protein
VRRVRLKCSRCHKHFITDNTQAILCGRCHTQLNGIRETQEYEREMLDALEEDPYVIKKRAELRALLYDGDRDARAAYNAHRSRRWR